MEKMERMGKWEGRIRLLEEEKGRKMGWERDGKI